MAGRRSRFIASSAQVKIVTDKALESSTSKIALKNQKEYHLEWSTKIKSKNEIRTLRHESQLTPSCLDMAL